MAIEAIKAIEAIGYYSSLVFGRDLGHRPLLGADESRRFYGGGVRVAEGVSLQNAGDEFSGEGITGADGIGNLHFRSWEEGIFLGIQNIAAVYFFMVISMFDFQSVE